MSTQAHRYKIVAAVDGSESSAMVVEHALDTASRHGDAEVHILQVLSRGRWASTHDSAEQAIEEGKLDDIRGSLETLAREALSEFSTPNGPTWRVRVHARAGKPHEEILSLAAEIRADCILVGRSGDGGRRHLLGSVPERVVKSAVCPVVVAQAPDYGTSEAAEQACPDCVAVREQSDGEIWFCKAHRHGIPWRTSFLPPGAVWTSRDQGLWF